MANKLFQEMQNNSLRRNLQQLKENPAQFLMQRKFNIPQEYQNNPQEMVDYLVRSGQVSQDQVNKVMQMAAKMGIKL